MGRKCSVYNCNSNYDSVNKKTNGCLKEKEKIRVYGFPLGNKSALESWVRSLPNKLEVHEVTVNMGVCAIHWPPNTPFERRGRYLVPSVPPSIFPGVPDSCVPTSISKTPRSTKKSLSCARVVDIDEMDTFRDMDRFDANHLADQFTTRVENYAMVASDGASFVISSKARNGPIHSFSLYLHPQDSTHSSVVFSYEAYFKLKKVVHPAINLLSCWSQFDELLNYLRNYTVTATDDKKLEFMCHSVELYNSPKNKRIYSVEDFSLAFDWYSKSRVLYNCLTKHFQIPSISTLKKITSISKNLDDCVLFQSIFDKLDERSRGCILIIDEVYIKASLTYRGGTLFGQALDCPDKLATTMLCVMAKCLFGSKSFLVKMIPCHGLKADFQYKVVTDIIVQLESCGAKVIGLINDNNRVNQSFFRLFNISDPLKPWIATSPVDPSRSLFLLFDTVHLLKNIRNSWITEKTQTINFEFEGESKSAYWTDLVKLYKHEEETGLPLSSLNPSSLNPSSIEKQKVSLALNVFSEKTSAALKTSEIQTESSNDTAVFIDMVVRLWKVFNTKTAFQHIIHRDKDRAVVDLSEAGQAQLQVLKDWSLLASKMEPISQQRIKCLTKDTSKALQWTCSCLVDLCHFLLTTNSSLRHQYVPLGFFQQDDIENHFAHFRMSAGCNYYISAEQIAHTHAQDRAKLMLEFGATDIVYDNSAHNCPMCRQELSDKEVQLLDDIPSLIDNLTNDEKMALFNIGGYIAAKHPDLQGDPDLHFPHITSYTSTLDRGGLSFPCVDLYNFVICCYIFVKKSDVKSCRRRLINLFEEFPSLFHLQVNVSSILITRMVNTFYKNVCRHENAKNTATTTTESKKRKLSKLSSS